MTLEDLNNDLNLTINETDELGKYRLWITHSDGRTLFDRGAFTCKRAKDNSQKKSLFWAEMIQVISIW